MILFVREGCHFCDQFKEIPGLLIATVVQTVRGPKAKIQDTVLELPPRLLGFPALVDGERIYIGKAAIEERLKRPT